MGSWNATCMVSNLPIEYGDDVKVIILKSKRSKTYKEMPEESSFCYSDTLYSPLFLQFDAKYNDYGAVQDIVENYNTEIIMDNFRKSSSKIKFEGNEHNEYTLYDIIEGIERGSLFFYKKLSNFEQSYLSMLSDRDDLGHIKKELEESNKVFFRPSNITFALIRKDIWDEIVDKYKGEFFKPDGFEGGGKYYCTAKDYFNFTYDKFINKLNDSNDDIFKRKIQTFNSPLKDLNDSYNVIFNNNIESIYNDIKNDYIELEIIKSFLSTTRKFWTITTGAGSQSTSWNNYKLLSDIVNKVCDEKLSECEEYDDYDD